MYGIFCVCTGRIGISLNSAWAEPLDPDKAEDRAASERSLLVGTPSVVQHAIRLFYILTQQFEVYMGAEGVIQKGT